MHRSYEEEFRSEVKKLWNSVFHPSLQSPLNLKLSFKMLQIKFASSATPFHHRTYVLQRKAFLPAQYAETKNNFNVPFRREWFSKWSENILRRNRNNKSSKCFSRVELLRYCWIWKTTFHLAGNQENKWKYKARLERHDKNISSGRKLNFPSPCNCLELIFSERSKWWRIDGIKSLVCVIVKPGKSFCHRK